MTKSIGVLALCALTFATGPALATHIHLTPGIANVLARIPSCRTGFHANVQTLTPGQPYQCSGPRLMCASGYRVTNVVAGSHDGDRIDSYNCTGDSNLTDYSGFHCGVRWEVQDDPHTSNGHVATYVCHRKLDDDRKTRCARGWNPGPEDFAHGISPTGGDNTYNSTSAFYGCGVGADPER